MRLIAHSTYVGLASVASLFTSVLAGSTDWAITFSIITALLIISIPFCIHCYGEEVLRAKAVDLMAIDDNITTSTKDQTS